MEANQNNEAKSIEINADPSLALESNNSFSQLLCTSKGLIFVCNKTHNYTFEIDLFKCEYEGQIEPLQKIAHIHFHDKLYFGCEFEVILKDDCENKMIFSLQKPKHSRDGNKYDIINVVDEKDQILFTCSTVNKMCAAFVQVEDVHNNILVSIGKEERNCMQSNCGPEENIKKNAVFLRSYSLFEYMSIRHPTTVDSSSLSPSTKLIPGDYISLYEYAIIKSACSKLSQLFQFDFPTSSPIDTDLYTSRLAYIATILYLFVNKPIPAGYYVFIGIIVLLIIAIIVGIIFLKQMY
ncbi:hypothetical protein WA158_001294 [Blastocystis sp. Blastoise]